MPQRMIKFPDRLKLLLYFQKSQSGDSTGGSKSNSNLLSYEEYF